MEPRERPRRRWWSWCRTSVRWTRITLLAACLAVLLALTWLRIFGLPDVVRHRLVNELADRGIVAEFESLKFHWFRGLVAEDLRVSWGGTDGPRITLAEVDLDIDPPPWSDGRLIRGLAVRDGQLVMPLLSTSAPPMELRIEHIAADLRFETGDAWNVRRLAAEVEGLQLELQAYVTNIALLRRGPSPPGHRDAQLARLRAALEEIRQWAFITPARLQGDVRLDGARRDAVRGDVYLHAPEVRTARGNLTDLRFSVRLQPDATVPADDLLMQVSAALEVAEIQTPQGGLSGLSARIDASGPIATALPHEGRWRASVDHLFLRGIRGRGLRAEGDHRLDPDALQDAAGAATTDSPPWRSAVTLDADALEVGLAPADPVVAREARVRLAGLHHLSREWPLSLELEAEAQQLGHPGFTSGAVRLATRLAPSNAAVPSDPELGPWPLAWPVSGPVEIAVRGLVSPRLSVENLELAAQWQPPRLEIGRLRADLYRGSLDADGSLDVLTRRAALQLATTFDLHGIDALLGPKSRENFDRYQWQNPPSFRGVASATLPRWNDRDPDWDNEVKPTVRLEGDFEVGPGTFKTVPFDQAASSVSYDGVYWRLPNLRTARPEGRQEVAVEYNEDTREYQIDARGRVFPHVLKPVLGDATAEVLDLFEFQSPVDADVTVWGPWSEGTRMGILGTVQGGAFKFRDQAFDSLVARLHYTNRVLRASGFRIGRGKEAVSGESARYDFATDTLQITNVLSTMAPAVVAAALSPEFPERIAPYRFDEPPTVRAQGSIRPRVRGEVDLSFDVQGESFHFWRLSAEQILAQVRWKGDTLSVTDINAVFYGGTLQGNASFDVSNPEETRYSFHAAVRDASLAALLQEATPEATRIAQGILDLDLDVTSANTRDIRTWNGGGHAELRNGLLWDVPIFGFLSPVLNSIVPGIGNNRAERASAHFAITNGVIHTRDLMIACPPARLFYRGTIDLDQRVDAKVEAQVLSDVVGVGPLFGMLLRPLTKLLEFGVSGTLSDVHAEPLYIPKFLLLPLRPMKTLKEWFGREEDLRRTTPLEPLGETNSPPRRPD